MDPPDSGCRHCGLGLNPGELTDIQREFQKANAKNIAKKNSWNRSIIWFFIIMFIAFVLAYFIDRRNYCKEACQDARDCAVLLPDNCEFLCLKGYRKINLSNVCEDLINEINKVNYLW